MHFIPVDALLIKCGTLFTNLLKFFTLFRIVFRFKTGLYVKEC